MVSCAVWSCSSSEKTHKKKITGITFHKFPKDLTRRISWAKFVNRINWQPSDYSVICSKHFTEDCFDRTSQCLVRLTRNAIPTINEICNNIPIKAEPQFQENQNIR